MALLGEDLALEKRQMELESEFEVAKADTLTPAEAKVQQGQEEWNALMSKFENLKARKSQIIREDEKIEARSSALRKKVLINLIFVIHFYFSACVPTLPGPPGTLALAPALKEWEIKHDW